MVARATVYRVVASLAERDRLIGEDARAAVEWLSAAEEDEASAVFSRRGLQVFLWYELPRKWLIGPEGHQAVVEELALFFDEIGQEAVALAELCRSPLTRRLLVTGGEGFGKAIEASGLEPPDTPLLEWSDLMTVEEALEPDAVAEFLEEAVDSGRLVPGAKDWRQLQAELTERFLITPYESGVTPLSRIHAARRDAWLELTSAGDERSVLEAVLPILDGPAPSPAEAEAAVEPLCWLLGRLAEGVRLTQTGALPRALVREAVVRYRDWWDTETVGLPYREAEIYPLEVLHTVIDELKLARHRRGILNLTPRGRALRDDPAALLSTIASTIAGAGASRELDFSLARLLLSEEPATIEFAILPLLGPFQGIVGGRFREPARLTAGGRTLAAAILRARAYGPRHGFA